jgi:hypothetical protein
MSGGNDKYVCVFVCNTENENCTYVVCTSCPGAENLEVLLHNELDDMTIKYKQRVVTDTATLMTVTQQCGKFIENLVTHHYAAKQQAAYFKQSKENQRSDHCTILSDFSA